MDRHSLPAGPGLVWRASSNPGRYHGHIRRKTAPGRRRDAACRARPGIAATRKGIPLDSQADSDFLKLWLPSNTGLSSTDLEPALRGLFFASGCSPGVTAAAGHTFTRMVGDADASYIAIAFRALRSQEFGSPPCADFFFVPCPFLPSRGGFRIASFCRQCMPRLQVVAIWSQNDKKPLQWRK